MSAERNSDLNRGIVIDIETFANCPNAAIVSIGACRFNVKEKTIDDHFYINVDPADCKKHGLVISKDTVDWWAAQPKEVLRSITENPRPLKEAMEELYIYLNRNKGLKLYAWGSSFDFPVIESSMRAVGIYPLPWKYWNVLCLRTISIVTDTPIVRDESGHHNALQDAIDQAKYAIDLFSE